jgi:hypothetical protein
MCSGYWRAFCAAVTANTETRCLFAERTFCDGEHSGQIGPCTFALPLNSTGCRYRLMSALGQKATCAPQKVMSALHPKADM